MTVNARYARHPFPTYQPTCNFHPVLEPYSQNLPFGNAISLADIATTVADAY